MSNVFIIDDRPDWTLSEEERKRKIEEAERILGKERMKEIAKEVEEWKKQNNK